MKAHFERFPVTVLSHPLRFPFQVSGIPQQSSVTASARAAITWLARPTRSR